MRLIKNVRACRPLESDNIRFGTYISRVQDISVPVYNSKGSKIRDNIVKRVVREVVPDEVLENRGINSSLFSLSNQLRSGVAMTPFSGDFLHSSLSEKQIQSEHIDSVVSSILDNSDNYVESSN